MSMMAQLKLPSRDSLGWLIPVLSFVVFYGGFLWFSRDGFLHIAGIFLFITGILGLAFSRRVRLRFNYFVGPKTPERREAFTQAVMTEAAKREARKAGIPELITELYFNYIIYFPSWIKRGDDDQQIVVPPLIKSARATTGNRILITLGDKEYIFTFVQYVYSNHEGERDIQATLQISATDQKLILLHLVTQYIGGRSQFRPVSIEYVTMSDWVNDFKLLRKLIDEEKKERYYEDRMN